MTSGKVRDQARRAVRVKITARRKSFLGFEVIGPDGKTLHHSPTKIGALTYLWARLRRAPVVYRVAVTPAGTCRVCGCTDDDCRQCIERTGQPCSWANAQHTLCTACAP
ncbi:MAG: hypothetical protein ACKVYV_14260 [Limisphaerales bacterium]